MTKREKFLRSCVEMANAHFRKNQTPLPSILIARKLAKQLKIRDDEVIHIDCLQGELQVRVQPRGSA